MPDAVRDPSVTLPHPDDLRAYVDYLRDLGIYDLLAQPGTEATASVGIHEWAESHLRAAPSASAAARGSAAPQRPAPGNPAGLQPVRPASQQAANPPVLSPFDQAQQRRAGTTSPPPAPSRELPRSQPGPNAGPVIHVAPPTAPTVQNTPSRNVVPSVADRITPPRSIVPSVAAASAPPASSEANWPAAPGIGTREMPAPTPFNQLAPLPATRVAPADKPAALQALRAFIGDCTRCPLAYAGRHSIVFADGDPQAKLMFVGEGPGADEDEQGLPFVGKAGQLLNNMITAMGLRREEVYIANIVKCRPPKNRVPEPVEANTCSPFLLQQIDIVQPEVIVALGGTAATYLLGVKQSLTSLRGQWFPVRGAKCVVTYHPAFLLRDPRQKGEAWKDLQRVMTELKLRPPARA